MTTEKHISELDQELKDRFDYHKVSDLLDSGEDFNADKAKEVSRDFYKEQSIKGRADESSEGLYLVLEKYVRHQFTNYDLEESQINQLSSRLVPEQGIETDEDVETELDNLSGLLEQ